MKCNTQILTHTHKHEIFFFYGKYNVHFYNKIKWRKREREGKKNLVEWIEETEKWIRKKKKLKKNNETYIKNIYLNWIKKEKIHHTIWTIDSIKDPRSYQKKTN